MATRKAKKKPKKSGRRIVRAIYDELKEQKHRIQRLEDAKRATRPRRRRSLLEELLGEEE